MFGCQNFGMSKFWQQANLHGVEPSTVQEYRRSSTVDSTKDVDTMARAARPSCPSASQLVPDREVAIQRTRDAWPPASCS